MTYEQQVRGLITAIQQTSRGAVGNAANCTEADVLLVVHVDQHNYYRAMLADARRVSAVIGRHRVRVRAHDDAAPGSCRVVLASTLHGEPRFGADGRLP